MSYLLDTNVISEFTRARPAPAVVEWLHAHQQHGLFLSVVTIGEIAQGIARQEPSERKDSRQSWLEETVIAGYADSILLIDTETMLLCGQLTGAGLRTVRRLPVIAAMIAATALRHGLSLVTRNESDFAGLGLTVVNPWAG